MEGFASRGGMLPEQVWDTHDLPSAGLHLGCPDGSAMPLMWAHAEYINLLRSVSDGKMFDLISVVADRYLHGRGRKDLEVWKPIRQVNRIGRGQVLRVQAPEAFRLVWTNNEWHTVRNTESTPTGLGIGYVDIPIGKRQKAPVRFTFFWTGRQAWEEKDYVVEIER